jgi:hypothetical protein
LTIIEECLYICTKKKVFVYHLLRMSFYAFIYEACLSYVRQKTLTWAQRFNAFTHRTWMHTFFTKDSFLIHDDDDALDMFLVLTKLPAHTYNQSPHNITKHTQSTHSYVYILYGSCFTYTSFYDSLLTTIIIRSSNTITPYVFLFLVSTFLSTHFTYFP